jgi:hypothetical protein
LSARAQLALEGSVLEPGESVRMVCPFCGGGSSKEKTLVLTHRDDGALLFVCHRAACTGRGYLGGGVGLGDLAGHGAVRPSKRAAAVATEVVDIPPLYAADLAEMLHFRELPSGWKYAPALNRIMLPVHSPKYERRGWVARSYAGATPKVLSYKEVLDQPYLHWAIPYGGGTHIVIVEDIPSAERIMQAGMTGCALMGTHCANDCLDEIVDMARVGPRIVWIALDKDAVKQSFKIMNGLALRVRNVVTRVLEKDVKDMTRLELIDWLNAGY